MNSAKKMRAITAIVAERMALVTTPSLVETLESPDAACRAGFVWGLLDFNTLTATLLVYKLTRRIGPEARQSVK